MNRQQFAEFIRNPELTDSSSIPMFEDLVERYPFCQIAQLLYAFNLNRADNLRYPVQLKIAAAYAGDRMVLKALIESARQEVELQSGEPVSPQSNVNESQEPQRVVTWEFTPPVSKVKPLLAAIESGSYDRMTHEELLAIVRKRLAEIKSAGRRESSPKQENDDTTGVISPIAGSSSNASKKALIEKFIREEPRISKPQATFFNPTDSAIRSNYDDEDIVSETLAQLYAEQGNIPKAIHIYQKLSLLNQEKSRYFAAQIEKLSSN
ncbi:MAG: hypothetical protein NT004_19085 [Bacteroidetes bacterium]|nr:hypothetical protein [Bacteroidota bacterium]